MAFTARAALSPKNYLKSTEALNLISVPSVARSTCETSESGPLRKYTTMKLVPNALLMTAKVLLKTQSSISKKV
jgi:hypothetical protein